MNNHYSKHAWSATGCLIVAILFTTSAWATRLNVKAVLADGSAAGSGISIRVTSGAFSATALTANNSRASFKNVPEGNATVSGQRGALSGERTLSVRGKNQSVDLTLGGATLTTTSAPQPPTVSLRIDNGAICTTRNSVTLNNTVSGPVPKAYRASEDPAVLRTAAWQLYNAAPAFQLSTGAGNKTVYIQVQSIESGQELVSAVASDTIKRPKANATLAINSGAGTTYSRTVTLNNTASFDPDGTNPKYLASERSDFSGATWQAYSSAPKFTLSAGAGTKRVYFMATKQACGAVVGTPKVSDTITLGEVSAVEPAISVAPTTHRFEFVNDLARSVNPLIPVDAMAYAASQGFTHSAARTRGDGSCSITKAAGNNFADYQDQMWLLAKPVKTIEPLLTHVEYLTCDFNLFAGRRLNTGWRVVSVEAGQWQTHPWSGIVTITGLPSGDNLNFRVSVPLPGYECGTSKFTICGPSDAFMMSSYDQAGIIKRLVIEGPTTDWHDAFKR